MKLLKNKFKSGAASFYVVAFSTLILVIIASSFASAIIMEIARSSNSDLSQSAYDAALAGVEDAKAAFINYQNCLMSSNNTAIEPNNDNNVSCGEIIWWMENPDCNMVGHILGRIRESDKEGQEVVVEEKENIGGASNNNMNQAYTCAIIQTKLSDYRADLNASNPYRIIKIKLDNTAASNIASVKVSWYSYKGGDQKFEYNNVISDASRVGFQSLNLTDPAVPPTLGVQLIQTAVNFTLSQLNGKSNGTMTDRAMVYLVPTNNTSIAGGNRGEVNSEWTYIGAYDGSKNTLTKAQLASTNDHSKDYPFAVYCPENSSSEYACSTTLDLPDPIGGARSDETFIFVVSLPYGQPETDFSLELICKDGVTCGAIDESGNVVGDNVAMLSRMQVMIDSTGRANDLYRRVEIRFEPDDNAFNFPFYAVQVDEDFKKMLQVTSEHSMAEYPAALNNL